VNRDFGSRKDRKEDAALAAKTVSVLLSATWTDLITIDFQPASPHIVGMKIFRARAFYLMLLINIFNCSKETSAQIPAPQKPATAAELANLSQATFAGGCFWCVEAVFESINGVREVVSGYSGGREERPTYEEVGSGGTGHAESVNVYYDPKVVSFASLVRVFLASIDPTQVNGQGPDEGRQYRSIIFYRNAAEKAQAERSIQDLAKSGKYSSRIAVEITAFAKFWPAEDYHQDYVRNHPENPYVQHESLPRLHRTLQQVPDLVRH